VLENDKGETWRISGEPHLTIVAILAETLFELFLGTIHAQVGDVHAIALVALKAVARARPTRRTAVSAHFFLSFSLSFSLKNTKPKLDLCKVFCVVVDVDDKFKNEKKGGYAAAECVMRLAF
jgi:hypothetical protein